MLCSVFKPIWKLEGEVGLIEMMGCFQKALDLANVELEHDVMGC